MRDLNPHWSGYEKNSHLNLICIVWCSVPLYFKQHDGVERHLSAQDELLRYLLRVKIKIRLDDGFEPLVHVWVTDIHQADLPHSLKDAGMVLFVGKALDSVQPLG